MNPMYFTNEPSTGTNKCKKKNMEVELTSLTLKFHFQRFSNPTAAQRSLPSLFASASLKTSLALDLDKPKCSNKSNISSSESTPSPEASYLSKSSWMSVLMTNVSCVCVCFPDVDFGISLPNWLVSLLPRRYHHRNKSFLTAHSSLVSL